MNRKIGPFAVSRQSIKDTTFQPALDLLNSDGLDIPVFVVDKDAPLRG